MKFIIFPSKMPTTQQQKGVTKRNGKLIFYNRRGTENVELQGLLRKKAPKTPVPKGVPIILNVIFNFKHQKKSLWGRYKETRPDLDNLMKNLQDYMTKLGYYTDDSQIVVLCASKFYGQRHSIEIDIEEVKT
ncbi:RusA family crossover junction endodeoxyribonuclease [Lactococcus taiwanensis]|uniref:RusA family crossover junction endodeoxyribonuclease n=1 Tax=Lactococcus taiwanensis TaxID=1151742 RepID=UPI0035177DB9